jgi:hypothetical protein
MILKVTLTWRTKSEDLFTKLLASFSLMVSSSSRQSYLSMNQVYLDNTNNYKS